MKNLQLFLICLGTALVGARSPAQIQLQSSSVELIGGAGSDNYGGNSYDMTSTNPNFNLSFMLYYAGYQGSYTQSNGSAAWTQTATDLTLVDSASQTVNPTPSFTNYNSDAEMHIVYAVKFQVGQASGLNLTAINPAQAGDQDGGSIYDGNVLIYSWAGSQSTSTPIALATGHVYTVDYNDAYATLGAGRSSTYTDSFAGSFDLNVTPSTPEPVTAVAGFLGLGAIARRARQSRRNAVRS